MSLPKHSAFSILTKSMNNERFLTSLPDWIIKFAGIHRLAFKHNMMRFLTLIQKRILLGRYSVSTLLVFLSYCRFLLKATRFLLFRLFVWRYIALSSSCYKGRRSSLFWSETTCRHLIWRKLKLHFTPNKKL